MLEDLQTAYAQLSRGEGVALPRKTSSYRLWSEALRREAQRTEVKGERSFWLDQVSAQSADLPVDVRAEPLADATRSVYTAADEETTRRLLHAIPSELELGVANFLLTAVLRALTAGPAPLLFDLMAHGRADISEDVAVGRTVGRFTSVFPVRLALDRSLSSIEQVLATRRQLRRVPRRGFNYGLLRYISPDSEEGAPLRSMAPICFNYAGRFDHVLLPDSIFSQLQEVPRSQRLNMRGTRRYFVELNTGVMNQALSIEWRFSDNVHRRPTVEGWANSVVTDLRELVGAAERWGR